MNVQARDDSFVIDPGTNEHEEFKLREGDSIRLNRRARTLGDIEEGDRVVVTTVVTPENKFVYEIEAFRPERHSGVITAVNTEESKIKFHVKDGDEDGEVFDLNVTGETQIIVNKKTGTEEVPLMISDLAEDDLVEVDLSDDTTGMVALKVDALRTVEFQGVIRKLEPRRNTITIADNSGDTEEMVALQLAKECVFTLNGVKSVDNELLTANDIKIGDRVSIRHDVKIKNIDAYRPFEDIGRITGVDFANQKFTLKSQNATGAIAYRIDEKTQILLGGEVVTLDELRPNDEAQLVHDMPDEESPTILSVNVTRPTNRQRWAILIGNDKFDDAAIPETKNSVTHLDEIQTMLTTRYGVPTAQVKVYENEARVRLEQELPPMIGNASSGGELYVYVSTRGFSEVGKNSYLATRDFKVDAMDETGINLDWLIDLIDASPASKKILMLDCATDVKAGDSVETSSSDMVKLVQSTRRGGYPKYTYVLANTVEGQESLNSLQKETSSLFAQAVAEAFAGKADKERDTKVEVTEFAKYVSERVSALAQTQSKMQTPFLFTPDDRPPRLSDAIQDRIIELLSEFKTNTDAGAIASKGRAISMATNGEPEPLLAAGLIMIERGKIPDALELLEPHRLKHRQNLLVQQSVIWIHYYKRHYDLGAEKLLDMLQSIKIPEKDESLSPLVYEKIEWAGRLRSLAAKSDWNDRVPDKSILDKCDAAVCTARCRGEKNDTLQG